MKNADADPPVVSGILRVPQYHGEMIWNKVRYLKDPETGRRVPRLNPPEEWQHIDVPELRIIDEKLWIAVQALAGGPIRAGKGQVRKIRLPAMFNGTKQSAVGFFAASALILCAKARNIGREYRQRGQAYAGRFGHGKAAAKT